MEPLSGKIREISHNVWDLVSNCDTFVDVLYEVYFMQTERQIIFVSVGRRDLKRDHSGIHIHFRCKYNEIHHHVSTFLKSRVTYLLFKLLFST
jgi:hypothetical protein